MKKSTFKEVVKEEIFSILKKSPINEISTLDFKSSPTDIGSFIAQIVDQKVNDEKYLIGLANILKAVYKTINSKVSVREMGGIDEATEEEVENQKKLNKELEKTSSIVKDMPIKEEDEFDSPEVEPSDDDLKKDSQITKLAGQLSNIKKDMKFYLDKYKEAKTAGNKEKERDSIKQLKSLTKAKNELEALL